ncbi:MAG TPA: extracellular solute-binding protein [Mycobacteriales bacterium]|nr:extracellular solute-binding protein [Mycobacteriales bacterium]
MTVLRGITWDHPRGLASVRGAAAAWRREHPDSRVEWDVRSLQGFADQPLESLVAGYDLVVLDHPHIPVAHAEGLLLPLDGTGHDAELADLAANSVGLSHRSYQHGGHQYGLAIDTAAQVAVYRPDLLAEPPSGWGEVLELARAGRVLWPAKPVDAISSFLTLCANSGAPVTAGGGFADPDAGAAALDLMCRLATLVPAGCLTENPIQTAERLSTRDDWWYAPLAFGYTNYSRAGFRPHRLAYVDIPAGAAGVAGSCLGGAGIAVPARTAQAGAAVEHAFWLASETVQRGPYYACGGQPGHDAAWRDDALNLDSLDFFRNTRRTLDGAWLRPPYPGWLDVQDRVGTLVNAVLAGELTIEACLRGAEAAYAGSLTGRAEAPR